MENKALDLMSKNYINHKLSIDYQEYNHWMDLRQDEIILVEKAFTAMKMAYAPYSYFNVGASVLLDDGSIITGNNQENIAYPSGLCAERVALFHVGSNFPNRKVKTVAIVAKGELVEKDNWLTPCGGCRQVMAETMRRQNESFNIILVSQNDKVLVFNSIQDLLPFIFGV
jgi:cytidine deaminase